MNDLLRPVSYIDNNNNTNMHFSLMGKISSRLIDFGQCRYVVHAFKSESLKGIHVYREKVRSVEDEISLIEKTFKILITGAILTGAVIFSPLLLLIPSIIIAVNVIFHFSNNFIFIEINECLREWVENTEVKGDKTEAAKRIKKAFINNSKHLELKNLGLTGLPSCIGRLSNLTVLNLIDNKLKTVPLEICELFNLSRLELACNELITMPKEISELSNLTNLDLSYNKLTILPKEIWKLSSLDWLYLSYNTDIIIPKEISELSNLTFLALSGINLRAFPLEICQLSKLTYLALSNNEHIIIPKEISKLSRLSQINLSNNKLETVPLEILQLPNLTFLDLSHNKLTSLPSELCQLPNLTFLYLSHNKLTSLPSELCQLSGLYSLNCSHNKLTSLPSELCQLSGLHSLHLSNNNLENLPAEIFQIPYLTIINLSTNNLTSLPTEIGQLRNLNRLDLSSNPNLEELPNSLGQIATLYEVQIEGTNITIGSCNAILHSCRLLRDKTSILDFPTRLKTWMGFSDRQNYDPKTFQCFDIRQLNTLNEWLGRLERSRDFKKCQKNLANLVCDMLENLTKDSDFKKEFFNQAEVNNTLCEDRSAMALNEIYVAWKIHDLMDKNSVDILELMIKISKTLALRRHLTEKIHKYQKDNNTIVTESVEIFLYYETLFVKEKIGIFTAIENMAYASIGKRDWIDPEDKPQALIDLVNQTYMDDLVKSPLFDKLVSQDSEFTIVLDKINQKYQDEMNDFDPNMKEAEYNLCCDDLMKKKNMEDKEAKKAKFQEIYKKISNL